MIKKVPIRIVGASKKYTFTKVPAEKAHKPLKYTQAEAYIKARESFNRIFDASEDTTFQGIKIKSIKHQAAKDLASRTGRKKWNKFLPKINQRKRDVIARYAKTHKGKISLSGITKAKEKAFVKTLKTADKKQARIYKRTHEKFTGTSGKDPFKIYTKSSKPRAVKRSVREKVIFAQQKSDWGFDPLK